MHSELGGIFFAAWYRPIKHSSSNSLSPSFCLFPPNAPCRPALPFHLSVVNAHWRAPVRPTTVLILFFSVLGKYRGASNQTGYLLRFQKMDSILGFRLCRWFSTSALTLWALLPSCLRVLYLGRCRLVRRVYWSQIGCLLLTVFESLVHMTEPGCSWRRGSPLGKTYG